MIASRADPGSGGTVAAVTRPRLLIGLGREAADAVAQRIRTVSFETAIAPTVEYLLVELAASASAPAVGDDASLALGYGDADPLPVFTGKVESVRHSLDGTVRVTASGAGARLARLRVNQAYEQQNAGDVVSDLAALAGVDTATIESGVALPYLVLDDRQSAWMHIADLALYSDYLCFTDPEGALVFAPPAGGQPVYTFCYGESLLALSLRVRTPLVGEVTVTGEGAAGSQGQDAWSWLVKDPAGIRGRAGDAGPARLRRAAILRSSEAVSTAAGGWLTAAGRGQRSGWLEVPGVPEVRPASLVEIEDVPEREANGQFLVVGLRHRLSKAEGLRSRLWVTQLAEGGLGLLP
jgi:phage protein D